MRFLRSTSFFLAALGCMLPPLAVYNIPGVDAELKFAGKVLAECEVA